MVETRWLAKTDIGQPMKNRLSKKIAGHWFWMKCTRKEHVLLFQIKIVAKNDLKQQIQLSKYSRFLSKTVAIFLLLVLHYTDTVRSSVLWFKYLISKETNFSLIIVKSCSRCLLGLHCKCCVQLIPTLKTKRTLHENEKSV